jgi:hypothetical protein
MSGGKIEVTETPTDIDPKHNEPFVLSFRPDEATRFFHPRSQWDMFIQNPKESAYVTLQNRNYKKPPPKNKGETVLNHDFFFVPWKTNNKELLPIVFCIDIKQIQPNPNKRFDTAVDVTLVRDASRRNLIVQTIIDRTEPIAIWKPKPSKLS